MMKSVSGRRPSARLCAFAIRLLSAVLVASPLAATAAPPSYTLFESGPVRPLAKSPDGSLLFAANTPDNRLEVFEIAGGGLIHAGSVAVGLEPVAVAARSNGEVWVVNHLSDSVSIVDVSDPENPVVTNTVLVGDEPRDIVFAGSSFQRAFITCAHRGQNNPNDPQLTTAGIGRADVWVFDAANLGATMGGTELTIITLFADTPRALAVTPDGATVYAAAFHSGNRTTALSEGAVPNGGGGSGLPPPNTDHTGDPQPEVGLIVRHDGTNWVDELGRTWNTQVKFSLPDKDVFAINANANPPVAISGGSGFWSGVGTVLFNMVVNPQSGKIYVSNTEAFNEVRFEGPGVFANTTVRGHLHESRITILEGAGVTPRHLNTHIDYESCCAALPNAENAASLAFPVDMVVSSDGATLYVAAFGSGKVGVFDTAALENNTFVPDLNSQIELSGGGPAGLVLDEDNDRLYVLTRFSNSISIVDTVAAEEVDTVDLYNPEPAHIVDGRPFLHDAALTSAHGDSACASCHVFGDFDSLAWDLGNPDDETLNNPGPFSVGPFIDPDFHPMKGPMTTQSLRGMDNHGPMHWRGDRTGGNDASSAQPNSGAFNEDAAFKKFNPAFVGLLGRSQTLTTAEMQAYTSFILEVVYPPNPIRNLDNTLTTSQQAGRDFYFGGTSDTFGNCNFCHTLDPNGNSGFSAVKRPGFFGSDGRYSFENEPQIFKVAHLRNMYQKVGMFGMTAVPFFNSGDNGFKGDQVRGFGFLHDGSVDTLFRFHQATVFNQSTGFPPNANGFPSGAAGDAIRRNVEQFMLAFDSNLAPIVGQQITRKSTSGTTNDARINLLIARANAGECELVVKGKIGGIARGYRYNGSTFQPDREAESPLSAAAIRALADTPGQDITYTCVPPGSGVRIALDRDEDDYYDRDELDAGSDPADPTSTPGVGPVCGDGTLEAGEDCDDGASNSDTTPNACRTDCELPMCGDGVHDNLYGEQCDDGDGINNDECRNDCALPTCGDGVLDAGEQCDAGPGNSDATPDACRTDCTLPGCGDGVVDPGFGDACDDGNASNTDACLNSCDVASCGDGFVRSGIEQCDTGASNSDTTPNACRTTCMLPSCGDGVADPSFGEACDAGAGNSDTTPNACRTDCSAAGCGDGVTDSGEDCDDADFDNEDACLNSCEAASCGDGFVRTGVEQCDEGESNSDTTPNLCRTNCTSPACGDGVTDDLFGEDCDDDNASNNDACLNSCDTASCGDGFVRVGVEECDNGGANSNTAPNACRTTCTLPECGDGVTDSGESCDDGNSHNGDSCRNDCSLPTCGDSFVNPGEQCDDGDADNTDACLNTCVDASCGDAFVQTGVEECDQGAGNSDSTPDRCRTDCTLPECGDGVADSGEACDDGNESNADGCRNDCTLPTCGDGFVNPGEQCDDGNADNTDACLSSCALATCGDGFLRAGLEQCDNGGSNSNSTPNACRTNCTNPVCGDAVTDNGETCDDGNAINTDACLVGCVTASCGDGFLRTGVEECDDGAGNSNSAADACRTDCTEAGCGDNVIDSGEACDGSALGGQTCSDLDFDNGELGCTGACDLDASACARAFAGKSLKVGRLDRAPGQQQIGLKSDELNGAGLVFNPLTEPVTVTLEDDGGVVWSATIEGGDPGWRLAGDKVLWKAPRSTPHPEGLTSMQIGLSGRPFTVKAKAKGADAVDAVGAAELTVRIAIGGDNFAGEQVCESGGSGATLKCAP